MAYACSIHKSQGSEFKMVILPLVKQYGRMLQRKLIYTAVTRSKDLLILMGEVEAFRLAIESEMIPRQTTLRDRLVENEETLKQQENQLLQYEEEKAKMVKEELLQDKKDAPVAVKKVEEDISLFDDEAEVEEKKAPKVYELTAELVETAQIDPMIGMGNISPYDFMAN